MTKVANLPGWVKGDLVTPVNNLEWNWDDVEDTITFQIPKLSPGYYAISVYEGPLSGSGIVPLETEWRNTRYRVLFNVPPPRDEEYVIFLTEIRCVDETNPESILGVNAQDEIFAYFAAVTGDQDPWQVEVFHEENYHDVLTPAGILTLQRPLEFDDDTTRYINEIKDGWLFGSERSISPVEGVVAIANMLIESDQGEADIAKYIADALLDIGEYVANSFLPIAGWVISFIKFVLREIIFAIIDWLAADVTVGQDLIVFTEDELYYLTAETNRMLIANSPHYFPGTVTTDSGIDIWIGNHYNEAKSFWEWRCYGNNDEPSEYWIKLEVIRVP